MKKNKILLLYVHPSAHKSRTNAALLNSIKGIEDITVRNLYDLYPDFHIDVKTEQDLLLKHDIIVFQHPFYWYSAPALLKEWIDLVFEHGFAFGRNGNALKGKKLMTAASTGGTRDAYQKEGHNHFSMNQFLAPFEQTARLCKMDYLPPFITHGSLVIEEGQIKKAADDYKKILISLRDNIFDDEEIMKFEYINDLLQ
jgi:glutathione-regulated potassium-efflux system ancillary protein KefG